MAYFLFKIFISAAQPIVVECQKRSESHKKKNPFSDETRVRMSLGRQVSELGERAKNGLKFIQYCC